MKIKIFWVFIFCGFSAQFPNTISKASSFYIVKILSQEDSKIADPILKGVKKALFFTSNAVILQSLCSTVFNFFSHLILIVQSKILWLNLKKSNQKSIYAICTSSGSFGVFFSTW
jgi:hypothetical protein